MWWIVFFFVKQKTAYEMRISDCSSDVCSSDLVQPPRFFAVVLDRANEALGIDVGASCDVEGFDLRPVIVGTFLAHGRRTYRRTAFSAERGRAGQIGRASCREEGCEEVWVSWGPESVNQNMRYSCNGSRN